MNETNRNPVIRVYPQTRQRLKAMAAQHQMTMQDLVEWLVAEQEKREQGERKDELRSIPPWRSANRWFDQEDFDDTPAVQSTHLFVSAFLVAAGDIVDGIQALYGEKIIPLTPPHGNLTVSQTKIELESGDRWSEISGFFGEWFGGNYVLQLSFSTHQGKVSGPFGNMNYTHNIQPFHLVIQPDEEIVALSGVVSTGDNGKNLHLGALGLILCSR